MQNNDSGGLDFYYIPTSPPCRSVMLLAKTLGVEMNMKMVDVLAGEQMKPEFVKVFQHDGGKNLKIVDRALDIFNSMIWI